MRDSGGGRQAMVAVGATVGRLRASVRRAFELGGRRGGGAVIYRRARGEAELTEGCGWGRAEQGWEGKPLKGLNGGEDASKGKEDRCVVLR